MQTKVDSGQEEKGSNNWSYALLMVFLCILGLAYSPMNSRVASIYQGEKLSTADTLSSRAMQIKQIVEGTTPQNFLELQWLENPHDYESVVIELSQKDPSITVPSSRTEFLKRLRVTYSSETPFVPAKVAKFP